MMPNIIHELAVNNHWTGLLDWTTGLDRAWRIMLIFLTLCYASNAHLLNIYASRIYYYAQYYAHSGS